MTRRRPTPVQRRLPDRQRRLRIVAVVLALAMLASLVIGTISAVSGGSSSEPPPAPIETGD